LLSCNFIFPDLWPLLALTEPLDDDPDDLTFPYLKLLGFVVPAFAVTELLEFLTFTFCPFLTAALLPLEEFIFLPVDWLGFKVVTPGRLPKVELVPDRPIELLDLLKYAC
jgi:hypothetical protein